MADGVAPPERPFPHPPLPGILRYTGFYRHCTVGSLMADREKTLLSGRVKRIQQVLGRELRPGSSSGDPLPEKDRSYLLDTAQEVRHRYSHFEIRFQLLVASGAPPPLAPWTEQRWVLPAELEAYPRPKVQIKAMRLFGLSEG